MTDEELIETGRRAMLGRLVPGAVHELANPLLALVGTVELLLQEADPETRNGERLTVVKSTSDEVAAVVRSLQQLARERLEPVRRVDLAAFALETVELVRRLAGSRSVELAGRASGNASVVASPPQLRQALATLLLDAADAAEAGGRVSLEVADNVVRVRPAVREADAVLDAVVRSLGATLTREADGSAVLALPS